MSKLKHFTSVVLQLAMGAVSTWILWGATAASCQTPRKVTQLADGVYEIQHADLHDGFTSGNTTVIIGTRQVFVVDSGFRPNDTKEDIAQIRQWTDKPVSFVLNTHFHNDHNLGNGLYMDSYPGLTIAANIEAKKDMDIAAATFLQRIEKSNARIRHMLESGKSEDGQALTDSDKAQLQTALDRRQGSSGEFKQAKPFSPTLTFTNDFTIDIGEREVRIKFPGRGNTAGDSVVYLPKEKIVIVGDLIVHPVPYLYDGYPSEWIATLERIASLDADIIVPGHGPVMRDKSYLYLVRDFMKSAVEQMDHEFMQTGPAASRTLDSVKGSVNLAPFRERFVGNDKDIGEEFDDAASALIALVFQEAHMR